MIDEKESTKKVSLQGCTSVRKKEEILPCSKIQLGFMVEGREM